MIAAAAGTVIVDGGPIRRRRRLLQQLLLAARVVAHGIDTDGMWPWYGCCCRLGVGWHISRVSCVERGGLFTFVASLRSLGGLRDVNGKAETSLVERVGYLTSYFSTV